MNRVISLVSVAIVGLMLAGVASADYQLNMTQGVTPFAAEAYKQHMIAFIVCCVIGTLVFGVMFYSMFMHRRSRGYEAAQFSHSTKAEVLWTVIPVLILIGMAIPATKALILMEDTGESDMIVKITGYQWMWGYEYVDNGIKIYSKLDSDSNRVRQTGSGLDPREIENYLLNVDNPIVLPTNTKIRFLITADDVIHSWWVPEFGWKRDAVPGFINEAWVLIEEEGVYRGQCAELCGKDHGFMPIVVIAKSPQEYEQWVLGQLLTQDGAVDDTDQATEEAKS